MIIIRRSSERGHANHGWLDTFHTFSFADYYDPQNMGFRSLRVINEDRVAPGNGFGTHPHRDMEILTWVLDGSLQHKDSMGNGSIIRRGEIQCMTAGTGVRHSEQNPSSAEELHLMQIWILPESQGLEPGYEQKTVPLDEKPGIWHLMASRTGRDDSVTIHQDADLWAIVTNPGEDAKLDLKRDRHAWLHVARGKVNLGGTSLSAGDAVAVSEEAAIEFTSEERSEVLVFDLA